MSAPGVRPPSKPPTPTAVPTASKSLPSAAGSSSKTPPAAPSSASKAPPKPTTTTSPPPAAAGTPQTGNSPAKKPTPPRQPPSPAKAPPTPSGATNAASASPPSKRASTPQRPDVPQKPPGTKSVPSVEAVSAPPPSNANTKRSPARRADSADPSPPPPPATKSPPPKVAGTKSSSVPPKASPAKGAAEPSAPPPAPAGKKGAPASAPDTTAEPPSTTTSPAKGKASPPKGGRHATPNNKGAAAAGGKKNNNNKDADPDGIGASSPDGIAESVPAVPIADLNGVTTKTLTLCLAADKDVVEDWRSLMMSATIPMNQPVQQAIDQILRFRLRWDQGMAGLVPVGIQGDLNVTPTSVAPSTMKPKGSDIINVAFTPHQLGWEANEYRWVWLQRAGSFDEAPKTALELFKARLRRFYQYYCPTKEFEVDAVLTDFEGNEELLFSKLINRYGPEPTEGQLERRRMQTQSMQQVYVPPSSSMEKASEIGTMVRNYQVEHLQQTGRFVPQRDETNFRPFAQSSTSEQKKAAEEEQRRRNQKQSSGGRIPLSEQLLAQSGDISGITNATRVAVTSAICRQNEVLFMALCYKKWHMWVTSRKSNMRLTAYLSQNCAGVLRRGAYEKWKQYVHTRRSQRQVQQSTQIAAKAESLVSDLLNETTVQKEELKRLRAQVEMLDNNNARRLETLHSSSELAIAQIRTLTAENQQKETLISRLEQRIMHVGNLMLQANDEKDRVIEDTAAMKLQLEQENEYLRHKLSVVEEALEGAKDQLEEWRPKPKSATCLHCEHYLLLTREIDSLNENADVLRARVRDAEAERDKILATSKLLAQQLKNARKGLPGGADDDGNSLAGVNAAARQRRRRGAGTHSSSQNLARSMSPRDYFNSSPMSRSSSSDAPPPPPPPESDSQEDSEAGGSMVDLVDVGLHGSMTASDAAALGALQNKSFAAMPAAAAFASRTSYPAANTSVYAQQPPQQQQQQQNYGRFAPPLQANNNNNSYTDPTSSYSLPRAFLPPAPAPQRPGAMSSLPPNASGRGTLPTQQQQQQQPAAYPPPINSMSTLHPYPDPPPAHLANADLAMNRFFHNEEARMDEKLKLALQRQTQPRLRTSGFSTVHGSLAPGDAVAARARQINDHLLAPVFQRTAADLETANLTTHPLNVAAGAFLETKKHERPKYTGRTVYTTADVDTSARTATGATTDPAEMRRNIFAFSRF